MTWLHSVVSALIAASVSAFLLPPLCRRAEDKALRLLAGAALPLAALALYLFLGRPDLPGAETLP